jgi:hypothetical protein
VLRAIRRSNIAHLSLQRDIAQVSTQSESQANRGRAPRFLCGDRKEKDLAQGEIDGTAVRDANGPANSVSTFLAGMGELERRAATMSRVKPSPQSLR